MTEVLIAYALNVPCKKKKKYIIFYIINWYKLLYTTCILGILNIN